MELAAKHPHCESSLSAALTGWILRNEPFIRYDRNHWGGRIVDQYLRKQRIRPIEQYELDSLEAIVIMVSRGLGVAIVPGWPPPWPHGVSVSRMSLPNAPVREIGLIRQRTSTRLPLIRAFVSEVFTASTKRLRSQRDAALI